MKLTDSENERNLNKEYIVSYLQVFEQPPGMYEILDIRKTLPSFITVTFNDTKLRTTFTIQPSSASSINVH